MAALSEIKIKIGKSEITEYISISLQQEMLRHHVLSVKIRRDHFEDAGQPIFTVSQDLIGESLKLIIQSPYKEKTEFIGIVTEIRTLRTEDHRGDIIQIIASSPDILLSDVSHYTSFEEKTLGKIVEKTLGDFPLNVKKNINPTSNRNIQYLCQYDESAYALLSRLAIRYGQWFYYDGKTLNFGGTTKKTTELLYGKDLFEFEFTLKLSSFLYDYLSHDYTINSLHTVNSALVNRKVPKISNPAFRKSRKVFEHQASHYFQGSLNEQGARNELTEEVHLSKSASVSNLMACHGISDNPNISLGSFIDVTEEVKKKETSNKLSHGRFIVIGLNHQCDRNGNYHNEFVALPAEIEMPPYTNPDLFVIAEPHSAIVVDNADPQGMGRVRVQFFWQKPESLRTPWIRLTSPHAGADKGFHFVPEVDEEVLVGFTGGNVDKPYVVGSLFHGIAKPFNEWKNNNNDFKAIRTRSGHTIEFIDKKGKEEIKIYDGNRTNYNYSVTLASHSKQILVEAKGDMEIKADNIKITANKNFELKATNIKQNASSNIELGAKSKMSLDGGAQMEQKASAKISINGGGQLEQKAAIVKIN